MRMSKLTLSADKDLIKKAKHMAAKEGTSLSSMFARFLQGVLKQRETEDRAGPITKKATGLVKLPVGKSDRELLEEALVERYKR